MYTKKLKALAKVREAVAWEELATKKLNEAIARSKSGSTKNLLDKLKGEVWKADLELRKANQAYKEAWSELITEWNR